MNDMAQAMPCCPECAELLIETLYGYKCIVCLREYEYMKGGVVEVEADIYID